MWSRSYSECISCRTTDQRHMAKGLCRSCYFREWRKKPGVADSQRDYKHAWYVANVQYTPRQKMAREKMYFDGHRQEVIERDNFRCTECGSEKMLVVHHLDGTGRSDSVRNNSVDSLITLCRACHARRHSTINRWARNYDCCVVCGTVERRHNAKGMCWKCYLERNSKTKI